MYMYVSIQVKIITRSSTTLIHDVQLVSTLLYLLLYVHVKLRKL